MIEKLNNCTRIRGSFLPNFIVKRKNIKWIAPEETIDSGESTFVDDFFAHEDYYEKGIIDSSYLRSERLKGQVKMIFGEEKLF